MGRSLEQDLRGASTPTPMHAVLFQMYMELEYKGGGEGTSSLEFWGGCHSCWLGTFV